MEELCLIDGCVSMGSKRGVCGKHHRAMMALVKQGVATWEQLAAKGMIRKRVTARDDVLRIWTNGMRSEHSNGTIAGTFGSSNGSNTAPTSDAKRRQLYGHVFKVDSSGPYAGMKGNRLFMKYVDSGEQLGKSGAMSGRSVLITVNSVTFACEQCNQHFGSCRCEAVEVGNELRTD
jgi:hypothetical protein